MLKYSRLAFLVTMLCVANVVHGNEKCTDETYEYLLGQNGKKLVQYIEYEGEKAFLINSNDWYKTLDLNQKKFKNGFESWKNFQACFDKWFQNKEPKNYAKRNMYYLKDLDKVFEKIENSYDVIARESQNNTAALNKLKNNLNEAIGNLTLIFNYYYMNLQPPPHATIKERFPKAIIDEYKAETGVFFDPTIFLNAYKRTKTALENKFGEKDLKPEEVLGILLGATGTNPAVIKITAAKINDNTTMQKAVEQFIATLEELNYQSNRINKAKFFWDLRSNPPFTLTGSQISENEKIIKKLYALYPAIITKTLEKRLNSSSKLSVILFAQARILMLTLRSYLRTVNALLQKK